MLKGFLGPIGDDLPSLIPLIFALMMFFYVFTFTWGTFDSKSQSFENALSALRVGNTMKGNNYYRGMETFKARCREAQSVKRVYFMAGLVPLSTGPGQAYEGFDLDDLEGSFYEVNGEKFVCDNLLPEEDPPSSDTTGIIIRSFPIAVEFSNEANNTFYVRPMLLVVVTWR